VGIAFSSRQFDGFGTQPEGIRNRMFGTLGVLETSYGGETLIRGKNFYRGGSSPAIYRHGAVEQHRHLPRRHPERPVRESDGSRRVCAAIW
jgi:hypothetical protein